MLTKAYWAAAAWTTIGLIGGLAYREITKANDFTGTTQLAVVHTHALVLGTLVMLLFLLLAKTFDLGRFTVTTTFFWTWQGGLALTVGMQAIKGYIQITDASAADSPALAGISGMGHITLTVAFVALFMALRKGIVQEPVGA